MAQIALVQAALRQWNPIGGCPGDELDNYAHRFVSMAAAGSSLFDMHRQMRNVRASIGLEEDSDADLRTARAIMEALGVAAV